VELRNEVVSKPGLTGTYAKWEVASRLPRQIEWLTSPTPTRGCSLEIGIAGSIPALGF
jgi:hypothetical protein